MSQRDHWKKKRPADVFSRERKSWLSIDTTGRVDSGRGNATRQRAAPQASQQDSGQQ
jgi:hypothetical protein